MDAQSISDILNPQPTDQTQKQDILGKEDFLKMLVAQMQNQNPLEPMKDQEFIQQMTSFSSLEQLQNMNDTLSQDVQWNMMLSQTISNTMATNLIGREVTAQANVTSITADGATPIKFTSDSFATGGTITIKDGNGKAVRTLTVSNIQPGDNSITWDGKDDNGDSLPSGSYSYDISLQDARGNSVSTETYTSGVVQGVRYFNGQAYLVIDGSFIPLADVRNVSLQDGSGG